MEVFAHFGQFGHSVEDAIVEIAGIAGEEAEAPEAWDFVEHFEDVGEADGFVAVGIFVGVDGLAEEGNFLDAVIHQAAGFFQDVFRRAGDFAAADVRDDAIGAVLIAAAHDADVRHKRIIGIRNVAGGVEFFQVVQFGFIV